MLDIFRVFYNFVVQNIPVCPLCNIVLDSTQEGIDFEFKKVNYHGREFDIVVPVCPKCRRRVKASFYIVQ